MRETTHAAAVASRRAGGAPAQPRRQPRRLIAPYRGSGEARGAAAHRWIAAAKCSRGGAASARAGRWGGADAAQDAVGRWCGEAAAPPLGAAAKPVQQQHAENAPAGGEVPNVRLRGVLETEGGYFVCLRCLM